MVLQISYFVLSILGIIKKKSRLLTLLMLFVMWVVFALCTYNGDYGNYEWIYENILNPSYWAEFEPLFNVMMYSCRISGLSFIQFRMIYATIFLALLYVTINRYTDNIAQTLGYFMIFPYIFFTSVIRSGLAGIIIVLAYHNIIGNKNKWKKFLILMLIATLIQYTSIFFLPYFFFRKMKIKSVLIILTAVLVILFLYNTKILYSLMNLITTNERMLRWYIPGRTGQKTKWALYLIVIDFTTILLSFMSKKYSSYLFSKYKLRNPYSEDIFYLNVSMLIFIPTFFVTNASARLIWAMLLFNIISFVKDEEVVFTRYSLTKLRYCRKDVLLMFLLMFFSFYANLPYRGTANDVNQVFYNNVINTSSVQEPMNNGYMYE